VSGVAIRVCVAALAVVVLAWLGVMERAARLQAQGVEATARQDFARAERDFRRARLLNPDTTPDLRRAYVHEASSRHRQAVELLEDVVRREPDNRSAWGVLEDFTREREPEKAERARRELDRLDPINSAGR
jgi:tetratricopeptide (TPR) repeat protein